MAVQALGQFTWPATTPSLLLLVLYPSSTTVRSSGPHHTKPGEHSVFVLLLVLHVHSPQIMVRLTSALLLFCTTTMTQVVVE